VARVLALLLVVSVAPQRLLLRREGARVELALDRLAERIHPARDGRGRRAAQIDKWLVVEESREVRLCPPVAVGVLVPRLRVEELGLEHDGHEALRVAEPQLRVMKLEFEQRVALRLDLPEDGVRDEDDKEARVLDRRHRLLVLAPSATVVKVPPQRLCARARIAREVTREVARGERARERESRARQR
jgi:hypothetical protein